MKAVVIEFDVNTGIRAGGISPKDFGLPCRGWQDLDSVPAIEIRLLADGRDSTQYEGIPGVTVLADDAAIDAAIDANMPDKITVDNDMLMQVSIAQKAIDLDSIPGDSKAIIAELLRLGVKGIATRKPKKMADIRAAEVAQL